MNRKAMGCSLPTLDKGPSDLLYIVLAPSMIDMHAGSASLSRRESAITNKKLLAAGGLIVAAVIYLIVSSTGSTAGYYLTVAELQDLDEQSRRRDLTLSGAVVPGSIAYDPDTTELAFVLVHLPSDPKAVRQAGGQSALVERALADPLTPRIEILYRGVRPDRLRDKAQPIVRGRLLSDGRFRADELLLTCPSRYQEAADPAGEGT